MYIYNVTFMTDRCAAPRFLQWLRDEALASLFAEGSPARSPKLNTVAEIPGESGLEEQAASFALQAEFDTLTDAHRWGADFLPVAVESYRRHFGPEALLFATILKNIPI